MNIRDEIRSAGMAPDDRSDERIELEFRSSHRGPSPNVVRSMPVKSQTTSNRKGHHMKVGLTVEEKVNTTHPSTSRAAHEMDAQQFPRPQSPPVRTVETPAEGTSEEHVRRPRRAMTPGETDFFKKPTMLSRLILNQKYGGAIKRVFNYPEEAKVWVCAKRTRRRRSQDDSQHRDSGKPDTAEGTIYTIRQLPVHIACNSLSRTHDSHMSRLLNELISVLIFAFPDGAHEPDHRSRLPIQDAIWYGASPDTIALFLMAKPEAIHVKDSQGRSLSELNRYRGGFGKESIQHLLNQREDFWVNARAEATARLQHNNVRFPTESNTISSVSVLASAHGEEDTILTNFSHQPEFEPDEIPPLSWDQLEKRLIASEQILTSINERNYELTKQVEALKMIDEAKGKELVQELTRMTEENAMLNEKLHVIENLVLDNFVTGDEVRDAPYRKALTDMSSLMGLSDQSLPPRGAQPVLQVTREAVALHKEVATAHARQRERIRKMRHVVEGLIIERKRVENIKAGQHSQNQSSSIVDDGSSLEESAVSALTSHSARSHLVRSMPRQRNNHSSREVADPVIVDRTPPSSSQRQQQIDDLDAILRFAAAKDKARLCAGTDRHRKRSQPMPDTDDLNEILQWATENDDSRLKNAERRPSVSSGWSPAIPDATPTKSTASSNNPRFVSPRQHSNRSFQQDDELEIPALFPQNSPPQERVEKVGAQRSGMGWHHKKDKSESTSELRDLKELPPSPSLDEEEVVSPPSVDAVASVELSDPTAWEETDDDNKMRILEETMETQSKQSSTSESPRAQRRNSTVIHTPIQIEASQTFDADSTTSSPTGTVEQFELSSEEKQQHVEGSEDERELLHI